MKEGYNFTMKEIARLTVIQSVIDKKRSGKEASQILNISERQVWKLVKKVRENGIEGIKHGNKHRSSSHAFSNNFKEKLIALKKSNDYCEANINHFKELLEEREHIKISYTSLYNILKQAGLPSKRKHRDRKIHRRRKRKASEGELVQADGTPFDWFNIGIKYSLHGFVDDATGKILGLYMCEHECLLGYLEVLRQMLTNYGIPKTLYPDKYSVFFPNPKQKITIEEELEGKKIPTTQFMDIVTTLGIHMFPASTSQAKGRIERLWNTLQDRLVTEFKINNITSIDEANIFLIKYIKKYNKKFAIEPESSISKFSPIPDYIDFDLLLTCKLQRTIDNSGTFSINNSKFQILDNHILPRVRVNIYISKKNGIIVIHNNTKYKVICIDNLPSNYSTQSFATICNESASSVRNFALELLSYDAKENEPILTSS